MDLLIFLPASFLGFKFFDIVSNEQKSYVARKIPQLKFWRFQFLPTIKIRVRGRVVHLHHWLFFSAILSISFVSNWSLLDHFLTRGLLFGGIIQGLRFPDRLHIVYRQSKLKKS